MMVTSSWSTSLFLFWDRISPHSPGWWLTHHVAKDDLKLTEILLFQFPMYYNYSLALRTVPSFQLLESPRRWERQIVCLWGITRVNIFQPERGQNHSAGWAPTQKQAGWGRWKNNDFPLLYFLAVMLWHEPHNSCFLQPLPSVLSQQWVNIHVSLKEFKALV